MAQARSGLWLLPALWLLQACGSTPFGQQLSDSFDAPAAAPQVSPAASPSPPSPKPPSPQPQESKATQSPPAQPERSSVTQVAPVKPAKPVKAMARPQEPQPYRITIRLSAADPSAPAEVVTRSLREAGIGFEVERIERIQTPGTLRVTPEPRGANP